MTDAVTRHAETASRTGNDLAIPADAAQTASNRRKQVREANVCYRGTRADECEAIERFLTDSLAKSR